MLYEFARPSTGKFLNLFGSLVSGYSNLSPYEVSELAKPRMVRFGTPRGAVLSTCLIEPFLIYDKRAAKGLV